MPQRHDRGQIKARLAATRNHATRDETDELENYARRLVTRGLASAAILDRPSGPRPVRSNA